MNKKYIYIIILFSSLVYASCGNYPKIDLAGPWKISYTDNQKYADPQYDDSAWESLILPKQTDKNVKVLWIRNRVMLPADAIENPAIFFGKIIDSDIVYFNGIEIGRTGQEPPKYIPTWNINRAYYIPPSIIKFNELNTIAVRAYAQIDPKFSDIPHIASNEDISAYVSLLNFSTRYSAATAGIIVLLLGLFSLLKYFFSTKKKNTLFFAIISILWAVLSVHFVVYHYGEYYNVKEKIYFSLLIIEISFIYFFLEIELGIIIKLLRAAVIAISAFALINIYSTPMNTFMGSQTYFIIGVCGIIEQLIWGILIIYSIYKKHPNSLIISAGYIFFMAGVVHDSLAISGFFIIDFYFISLSYPALLASFGIIMLRDYSGMEKELELMEEISGKNKLIDEQRIQLQERNEILENDLKMAKIIQQKFISDVLPDDSVYALYKPMEAIGGDYYEFIKFSDPAMLGIFISDVSGHGVPAALITAMLKSFIEQSGSRKNDPAELISYLNSSLIQLTGMNFITAFYGIYNTKDRTFTYANAGHVPPFVITDSGISSMCGVHSFPLTVFNEEQLAKFKKNYINNIIRLEKDSTVILYTDGLTEARNVHNPDNDFEYEKLISLLMNKNLNEPKFIIEETYRNLVSFRGCESFDDDVCIICMKT